MIKKIVLIALSCIVLLIAAIFLLFNPTRRNDHNFNGSIIEPPVPAADFTLTNQDGRSASLSDLQGKYLLIFFGFTSCVDECPATMAILSQVRNGLDENADQAQIVFISTDPARDSPSAVKTFIDRFDPTSIGFTGSLSDLQPVWKDYGVMVMDNGETHSIRVYLVDPEGNWRLTYAPASNPQEIIDDIELLIKGY
ncbi:MAG: SCO family protein [Chloroflexota bacterium]